MDEFYEFKQYVRCKVRTLDDKLITEIRVFNIPRVGEILWFSPHNGHETDVPTSYIVKEAGYLNCFIGSNSYSLNADYSDTEQWEYHTDWMKSFIYKIERNQSIQITKELALSLVGDL